MTTSTEARFDGEGGLRIFYRVWRPAVAPRALVVIVHGFNAHSGHYQWTADQLTAQGFVVYALDLRGRGQSDGERFFVQKFADYEADVTAFVRLAKSREAGLKVFVLGHSAGGVVSCNYALDHQAEIDGLICESFAFQVPAPDFALAALKGLSHLAPHAHVLKLKNEDFSRDASWVATMNADPLIQHEVQPTLTVAEMARADERLNRDFPKLTLPLLILHGTQDKATKPSGSRLFYETAGASDKTLKLYEGHYHDLLNDLGKETVMADIGQWLSAHVQ